MSGMKQSSEDVLSKWRPVVREQQQSGMSARAFCEKHGHVIYQFNYWKDKIRKTRPELRFAPVVSKKLTGPAQPVSSARLMVEVGKARVEVRQGFDRGLLRQVLAVLGGEA
jgi:hypothetical protein